jgi:hypothetical protein
MRMLRIVLSSVACLGLPYFPHYLINDSTCGEKFIEHKMRVLFFSTISVWKFLILSRIRQDTIINVHISLCQVLVIPLTLQSNLNLLDNCRKILKHEISLKSIHWETNCSKRTDGNTEPDMTKLIVYFLSFVNVLNNCITGVLIRERRPSLGMHASHVSRMWLTHSHILKTQSGPVNVQLVAFRSVRGRQ